MILYQDMRSEAYDGKEYGLTYVCLMSWYKIMESF